MVWFYFYGGKNFFVLFEFNLFLIFGNMRVEYQLDFGIFVCLMVWDF